VDAFATTPATTVAESTNAPTLPTSQTGSRVIAPVMSGGGGSSSGVSSVPAPAPTTTPSGNGAEKKKTKDSKDSAISTLVCPTADAASTDTTCSGTNSTDFNTSTESRAPMDDGGSDQKATSSTSIFASLLNGFGDLFANRGDNKSVAIKSNSTEELNDKQPSKEISQK
jgi:hypothetical protein